MITSAEEFEKLRCSDNMADQDRATWEEASVEIWLDVIERYSHLKSWVIHNKKVPHKILEILSDDNDSTIRGFVAHKGSAGLELLWKMYKDESSSVRSGVIANRKVPKEILEILSHDPDEDVAEFAKKKLQSGKRMT